MIKPNPGTPDEKIWLAQKAKLKKAFPFLTEDDLKFATGKKDVMLNHLQITLGKTKTDLEAFLTAL